MISVCIPTYNGEKFIKQQLDSILNQSIPVDEIVISDDSSTDKTVEIIKSYNDKRIILLENQTFKSPIFNIQHALINAQGDFIFLADQDDIWFQNKVEMVMGRLKNYNLVVTDCNLIDEDNNVFAPSLFKISNSGKGFMKNFIKNTYHGSCMAFDRGLLNQILPFPRKIAMHDIWIGLNAELHSSINFCNTPLMSYRRHRNNATPLSGESKNSLFYKLKYRTEMLLLVLKNYILIKLSSL